MKTGWFLLLIFCFVGLLIVGLPSLIAVDLLQKGEPFQKVLEDVPAKTLNIYREVLEDQLRLLHFAQAQPTSSPSPTPLSASAFRQALLGSSSNDSGPGTTAQATAASKDKIDLSAPVLADQSDSGHSDLTRFVELHAPGVNEPAYVAWMRIALVAGNPQIKEVFIIAPMYKDDTSNAIITRSLPRESNVTFDSQGDVSADGGWLGVWTLSFYAKATGSIIIPLEMDPKIDYSITVAVALRRTLETFLKAPLPLTPISGFSPSDAEPWEVKAEMSHPGLALARVAEPGHAVGGYGKKNVTTEDSPERYAYQLWDNTERKFFGMVASGYPEDYRGGTLETTIFVNDLHDPKLSYRRRLTKSSQLEVWQGKDDADRIRYVIYNPNDDFEFFRVKYICDGTTWEKEFSHNEAHFVRSDNLKILTISKAPEGESKLLPLTHEGEQLIQKYPGPQDSLEIWRLTDEPNELRMYNQIAQMVRVWYMVDGKRRDILLGSKPLSTSVEDIHGNTIKILKLEGFNVTK